MALGGLLRNVNDRVLNFGFPRVLRFDAGVLPRIGGEGEKAGMNEFLGNPKEVHFEGLMKSSE